MKLICGFVIFHLVALFVQGMQYNSELRKLWTPMMLITLASAYVMVMVLAVRDNNTLGGRRVMLTSYLVCALVAHYLYYTMIYNEQMWGTTAPKALCKGSKDASCVTDYEQICLADNAVGFCLNLYFTWILYKYYQ